MADLNFTINGRATQLAAVDADRTLLEVLREQLQLTGTKYGCGEGACGACTVLLDGKPTFSCTTPASDADGKTIVTIEGLARGDELHPVQQAFVAEEAFQCGYCTAGMIMAAAALLDRVKQPSDEQITAAMNGHICRCCTYPKIVAAVRRAAEGKS